MICNVIFEILFRFLLLFRSNLILIRLYVSVYVILVWMWVDVERVNVERAILEQRI